MGTICLPFLYHVRIGSSENNILAVMVVEKLNDKKL